MVRRLLVAVMGLALVAGCGGGTGAGSDREASAPAASPPTSAAPPVVYSDAQLAAALPRTSQVPTASKKTQACPGGQYCVGDDPSVTFGLTRPGSAVDQERSGASSFVDDAVIVAGRTSADDDTTTARVAKLRKEAAKYEGDFDIAVTKVSGGFQPGEKGSGTLEDSSLDGWSGFQADRVQTYVAPDDKTAPFQISQLVLARGSAQISVNVYVLSAPRGDGAASDLARRLAQEYIARLG